MTKVLEFLAPNDINYSPSPQLLSAAAASVLGALAEETIADYS